METFRQVPIGPKLSVQHLSESHEKLLLLLIGAEVGTSWGIYFPAKANYRQPDLPSFVFKIDKGTVNVDMSGRNYFFIDEDGDLGINLMDDEQSGMVKMNRAIPLNRRNPEAYTLAP